MGLIEYPASAGDAEKVFEAAIEAGAEDVDSDDDGHRMELSYDDGTDVKKIVIRGVEIRYKAVEGLARRGSESVVKRFGILEEMLDEDRQKEIFRIQPKSGKETADETLVTSTVRGALRGITELHRKKPDLDLSSFDPAIDKLLHSSNPELRAEAERTRIALNRKSKGEPNYAGHEK